MNDSLYDDIFSEIERIRKETTLYCEQNFSARSQAIDELEFHIIDRIDGLYYTTSNITALKRQAEKLKCELEGIDRNLLKQLRNKIATGNYRGQTFTDLICAYVDIAANADSAQDPCYDDLDLFLNGLLTDKAMPVETKERQPEMVFYQKTPARVILELVKSAQFKPGDVFFDLGSGLGQVSILVHLLASVPSTGVEIEPAFCEYATGCANALNLKDVTFTNTDARDADYSSGTVFFMYTPFEGQMLLDVMHRLSNEAKTRQIKLFTYGPCTAEVAKQDWLIKSDVKTLGEFISKAIRQE